MRSMSCLAKNLETISGPKVKDTPLSFSPQPFVSLSGSDHNRSQSKPVASLAVNVIVQYTWEWCRLTLIWNICWPHDSPDLLHRLHVWREPCTQHSHVTRLSDSNGTEALPPWQQNIFSSRMAATGRQLKQSVNVFHKRMLYLRLPEHIEEAKKL